MTGRPAELVDLVERYTQGAGPVPDRRDARAAFDELLELDLATVEPSMAGPRRPQDRVVARRCAQALWRRSDAAWQQAATADDAADGRVADTFPASDPMPAQAAPAAADEEQSSAAGVEPTPKLDRGPAAGRDQRG